MNGTILRLTTVAACLAALAAPSGALAKTRHHRPAHKTATTVVVPHTYDAGGNGAPLSSPAPGTRINLFDPVEVAVSLGNNVLGQLGLPAVQLP